jgi:threonine aldolase
LIAAAWRFKHLLGGAMRQSGIIAAGCLYGLDHHVERMAEDHDNARALADGLAQLSGVRIDATAVQTNIVVFEVADAPGLVERLAGEVELSPLDGTRVRAVTHLDVDRAAIDRALVAIGRALA